MQREPKVFLEDIIDAAGKIEKYTEGFSFNEFLNDDLVADAVIKNILVIGEATKNILDEMRLAHPQIEWRKMAGMRDMIIHGYFSINYRIVWDVVKNKIPIMKRQVEEILEDFRNY